MAEDNFLYLDHNATTPPAPAVIEAMVAVQREAWANPSSVHRAGQGARRRVELARAEVARLVGTRERHVVFTSGGTEANDLALGGLLDQPALGDRPRVLVTSAAEHAAVREPAEALASRGVTHVALPVDRMGRVGPAALEAALAEHATGEATVLVSIIWAHNETGGIQPMAELAEVVTRHREARREAGDRGRLWFHSDATQAVGKFPVTFDASGLDLLTCSAHKLHGPKGIGALVVGSRARPAPRHRGGPQEQGRRGGTENVPGIVGFGVAAELAARFLADEDQVAAGRAVRDAFEAAVVERVEEAVVHGAAGGPRLWNTASIGFPRFEAEALVVALSERGVCASAGSACSSGSLEPSPALRAMGIAPEVAHGTLRFSFSRDARRDEALRAANIIGEVVDRLRRSMPPAG